MTDAAPPQVYQFRVFVRGISPVIWRRLLLRDDQTLGDLHHTLQIVLGWQDEALHRIRLRGRTYAAAFLGALAYDRNASETTLKSLRFRLRERFLYEYDFMAWWQVEVRYEQQIELDAKTIYPRCIAGKRAGPLEDYNGPADYLHQRDHNYHPGRILVRLEQIIADPDDAYCREQARLDFPDLWYTTVNISQPALWSRRSTRSSASASLRSNRCAGRSRVLTCCYKCGPVCSIGSLVHSFSAGIRR